MQKYNYIIYHKDCLDGYSGLFIAYYYGAFDESSHIYPDVPSARTIPPGIKDKDILIIDVAYNIDLLEKIIEKSNSVTFIDHHDTIYKDVMSLLDKNEFKTKLTVIFDREKCGSSLVWNKFFPDIKRPSFIKYVEDHDTGTWKHIKTKFFIFGLESNYKLIPSLENLEIWKKLLNKDIVKQLCEEGLIINKYHTKLIEQNYGKYSLESFPGTKIYGTFKEYFKKIGQYSVAVYCGLSCPSVNGISEKLLNSVECNFTMIWTLNIDKKEYIISMRSREVDVGSIAKLFGGGGHKFAAAFTISSSIYNILDLFEYTSLTRKNK